MVKVEIICFLPNRCNRIGIMHTADAPGIGHCSDFSTLQTVSGPFTAFAGNFPSVPNTSIASYFSILPLTHLFYLLYL